MIFDESRPVVHRDPLPDAVDVIIIGGGIAGICTAYYLAKAGASILVCEKGRVAGEQSSRNWGWIRQQFRDPGEVPLAMEANRLWEEITHDLDEDIGFARTGVLYATSDPKELSNAEQWMDIAEQHQLDTRVLTGAEVEDLMKGPPDVHVGGIYTASDAKAEPFKAVPAIARACVNQGVLIREDCAVRNLVSTGGRVRGVLTEHGEVKAQSVVCAGGAWTARFLGNLGVWLPQLSVRGTVVRTERAPDVLSGAAAVGHLGIRRRQDGGYTIATATTHEHFVGRDSIRCLPKYVPVMMHGSTAIQVSFSGGLWERLTQSARWRDDEKSPFEKTRILNPAPSEQAIKRMKVGLQKYMPMLADVPIAQAWAGMIDALPDVVPVMDAVPGFSDVYVATGFSGHGFGIGPSTGKTMADMVLGNAVVHDLDRFRFSRFSDGSKMMPGPGI